MVRLVDWPWALLDALCSYRWIGNKNVETTHPELVVRLRDFYRFRRSADTVINQAEILVRAWTRPRSDQAPGFGL